MANFATQSDVEALLGRPLTTTEAIYATRLIATASGKISDYLNGQQISAVSGDTITVRGNWTTRLTLPQRPVTNVTSITGVDQFGAGLFINKWSWDRFGNIDLASGTYTVLDPSWEPAGYSNQLWGPAGTVRPETSVGPNWGGPAARITVTYDHGFPFIPSTIVDECAAMVAAQLSTPVGIREERIGGYEVQYIRAPGAALTLSDASKSALDKFRRTNYSFPTGRTR